MTEGPQKVTDQVIEKPAEITGEQPAEAKAPAGPNENQTTNETPNQSNGDREEKPKSKKIILFAGLLVLVVGAGVLGAAYFLKKKQASD